MVHAGLRAARPQEPARGGGLRWRQRPAPIEQCDGRRTGSGAHRVRVSRGGCGRRHCRRCRDGRCSAPHRPPAHDSVGLCPRDLLGPPAEQRVRVVGSQRCGPRNHRGRNHHVLSVHRFVLLPIYVPVAIAMLERPGGGAWRWLCSGGSVSSREPCSWWGWSPAGAMRRRATRERCFGGGTHVLNQNGLSSLWCFWQPAPTSSSRGIRSGCVATTEPAFPGPGRHP